MWLATSYPPYPQATWCEQTRFAKVARRDHVLACSHLLSHAPYAFPCSAGAPWHRSRCSRPLQTSTTRGEGADHVAADSSIDAAVCMPVIVFRWRYESRLDASLLVALRFVYRPCRRDRGLVALWVHQKIGVAVQRARCLDSLIMASSIKRARSYRLPDFCRSHSAAHYHLMRSTTPIVADDCTMPGMVQCCDTLDDVRGQHAACTGGFRCKRKAASWCAFVAYSLKCVALIIS